MTIDEFTPRERDVIELLRSNDPSAAEKLVALNDAERARVLAYVTSVTASERPLRETDDEVSEEPQLSGPASPETAEAPESSDDEAPESSDDETPEEPSLSGPASPETAEGPEYSKPLLGIIGTLRNNANASKIALTALSVGLIVVFVVVVRACGGADDRASTALLLVRESSSDLYIVEAGGEVNRTNRAVQDVIQLRSIEVTIGEASRWTQFAAVGERQVIVARTESGEAAWVIDGDDYQQIIDSERGTVGAVVVDGTLYIKEESEGSQRCYRGSPDDLERVSRGDHCEVTKSGHVFIADRSDESYGVRVQSPEGDELLRASFSALPQISDNGLFVVAVDEEGVTVTSVGSGDRVWEFEGGVSYDIASHRDGYLAIVVQAASGELILALVDSDSNADELAEVAEGRLVAEFAESGNLFWVESDGGDGVVLSVWDSSEHNVVELADEDSLRLVGVYNDSAVTAKEDDLGVQFERFSLEGSESILHEFDDTSGLQIVRIEGDYLYTVGNEIASVVRLGDGEAVDSEPWDLVSLLDYHEGSLIASGVDGSSEVLFGISVGSDRDVEYGQYDAIASAQLYGNTLYASIVDGSRVDTLAFDVSSGDQLDDEDYDGYGLINIRERTLRNSLSAWASQIDQTEPDNIEAPAAEPSATTVPAPNSRLISGEEYAVYYSADLINQAGGYRLGTIGYVGEIDRYVFEFTESSYLSGGPVVVQTFGSMDTVVEVYRLLSLGSESFEYTDDDGGQENNAQVELWLEPDWYLVVVSGFGDATGHYEVHFSLP